MKKMIMGALLLTGLVPLQAQNTNTGVIAQERQLPLFTTVVVEGTVEIVLSQGPQQKVVVETEAEFQEAVRTTVKDEVLTISAAKMRGASKLDVRVTAERLKGLVASGATEVNGEGPIRSERLRIEGSGASDIDLVLEVTQLELELSGASTLELEGTAGAMTASVSGAADLKAGDLVSPQATIKTSGASSAYVNITEEVNADMSGVSDIKFKGEPRVKNINSKGSAGHVTIPEGVKVISEGRGDSTVVKVGEIVVKVIDGDTTIVSVGGNRLEVDEDGNVEFVRKSREKFDGHWGGFDLGVNGYLNADNEMDLPPAYDFLDLRLEKSIHVGINFFEQNFNLIRQHVGLITGVGLEYTNYRFDNNVRLSGQEETIALIPEEEGEERNYSKSKLVVNYLRVPLILEYQTNRHAKASSFHLSAGVIGGLRIGSHTKMVWEDGGTQKNKVRDDFHLNPLKAEGTVRLGWGVVNLFANYSFLPLFKEDEGPELYPFSVGLTLSSW
ncbi:MAG TPA: DUF2807 domain-containing protein [Bacteroidales bacterium]|nr:DUF2807 domain-containing protein [Bacteroidales bacterium]